MTFRVSFKRVCRQIGTAHINPGGIGHMGGEPHRGVGQSVGRYNQCLCLGGIGKSLPVLTFCEKFICARNCCSAVLDDAKSCAPVV